MKNLISLFFLFIVGAFWGQESLTVPAIQNVFWEITNPENEAKSYLFGTIHMIDKDKFVLPKSVEAKLKSADKLFLELDDLSDKSAMIKLTMLEEGRMTDILSKDQRDSVYAFVESEYKMDSAAFEKRFGRFKPFFFSQLGMMKVMMSSKSYDKTFNKIAVKADIPILGLETMEEQVSFFDNMSEEMKVEMIMSTIHNHETFETDWENMQNMYLLQEIDSLVGMDKGSEEMKDFLNKVMMKNRNEKWVIKLQEELKTGNIFIGVGAAHLVGEFGLIQLLTNIGFQAHPIEIELTK